MKNATRFSVIIGLVIAIVVLSLPIGARADYTYLGTNRDDTIYFGYCDTCYNGGPGLLICRETGGTTSQQSVAMDNGVLVIRGRYGDDYIKAVHDGDKGGCRFGNFDHLTYSSIRMEGGNGNDCLIGCRGEQTLSGGSGDDYLRGYPGDDELRGGLGNDYLLGDQGNDRLLGGDGNDILVGGTGDDYIDGGSGRDTFRCRSAASAILDYDGSGAATDCGDSTSNVSIEVTEQRDPYREWAYMTAHRNKKHKDIRAEIILRGRHEITISTTAY
nr:hypothetical secreted protein containing hemolysin-type calcium-binding repeats [uncultured archaeon]